MLQQCVCRDIEHAGNLERLESRMEGGGGGENRSKLSHELIVKLEIRVSQKLAKLGAGRCP